MAPDFMPYEGEIYGFIKQMIGDGETARDICQDVFVKAVQFERRMGNTMAINWRAWLYRVAKNMSLNYLKFRKIRLEAVAESPERLHRSSPPGDVETRLLIRSIMEILPERHRRVIELRDVHGLSYARIAEVLGLSQSAVTSLLNRARENFRREYLLAVAPEWVGTLTQSTGYADLLRRIDPLNPQHDLKQALKAHVQRYFSENYAQWDDVRDQLVAEEWIDWLIEQMPLHQQMTVLDIGTGTGHCALALAGYVAQVIGLDQNEKMLERARQKVRQRGMQNVTFRQGDFEHLPLPDQSVDALVCNLALHHAVDPLAVLRECRRVLRPQGQLLVCDFLRHDQAGVWESLRNVWLGFDPQTVERWFHEVHFRSIQVRSVRRYLRPLMQKHRIPGIFCVSGLK